MTTEQQSIAAFVAVLVGLWAAFGFVIWDWNPQNWAPGGRALYVWLSLMFGFLAAIGASIRSNK